MPNNPPNQSSVEHEFGTTDKAIVKDLQQNNYTAAQDEVNEFRQGQGNGALSAYDLSHFNSVLEDNGFGNLEVVNGAGQDSKAYIASKQAVDGASTIVSDVPSNPQIESTRQVMAQLGNAEGAAKSAFAQSPTADESSPALLQNDFSYLNHVLSSEGLQTAEQQPTPQDYVASLSPAQKALMTSGQIEFAGEFRKDTDLNPDVIEAWLLAEQSGPKDGPSSQRQAANNDNWLDIGYTDTANLGTSDSFWTNPVTAADKSAEWLNGTYAVPGFGPAAPTLQSALREAGSDPDHEISELQQSGWASSGYPLLMTDYKKVLHPTTTD